MINKVCINNIDWQVIEEIPNELLNEREQYWIKYYNSKDNGYNCTYGGYNGTKYNYNEILDYWLNEGERNFTKTAEHFGSSKSYISEIIHSLGYEGRNWSEINKNNHNSFKRQVNKIDPLTGKVLKTYDTITEAAQDMGDINYRKTIGSICSGHRPTYLGYCWQYKEDIGKPIYLNKQQKIIVLVNYDIEFNTLNECAEWFINNNKTRSTSVKQVAAAIRYGLNHSKSYQGIKLREKEKVIYSYYE